MALWSCLRQELLFGFQKNVPPPPASGLRLLRGQTAFLSAESEGGPQGAGVPGLEEEEERKTQGGAWAWPAPRGGAAGRAGRRHPPPGSGGAPATTLAPPHWG